MNKFVDCSSLVSFKVIDVGCDPTCMGEYFNRYVQENYHNSPTFFLGTLQQAVNEAFHTQSIEDVCLALC
jgi:hypothetical protein